MSVLLFVSILATLLTYLEGNRGLKGGMKLGFSIVFLITSIRDNYGNDFPNYLEWFTTVSRSDVGITQVLSKNFLYGTDNGWSFLCYLFSPFGFNFFVASITIFTGVVYYHFIKDNVDISQRWLAVFVYLFSTQMFVLDLSMMRQAFAITLFVLAYKYARQGKLFVPLAITSFSFTFHSSAIITIPFLFFDRLNFKRHKLWALLIVGSYITAIPIAKYSSDILTSVSTISTIENYAETYVKETKEFEVGIGYLIMHLPFVLYIYHLWKNNITVKEGSAIVMSCIPFLLLPFKEVPMSERLGYFFIIFSIMSLPLVFFSLKKRVVRKGLLLIYLVQTFYSYINFFNSPIWRDKFLVYHTIFG